ncbi:MAG: PqqD family protein [Alphaproteobacteria bacterium]
MTPRYRRAQRWDQETLATDLILMNPDSHAVVVLNATGALVWDAIAEGASLDDVASLFHAAAPGVATDRVRADIADTLDRLVAAGLAVAEPN